MKDATTIIERLKTGVAAQSDTDLARKIGIGQQSISNARSMGKIPDSWIRKAAEDFSLSSDWLWFGVGSMRRNDPTPSGERPPTPHIDEERMIDIVSVLEEFLEATGRKISPETKAMIICQLYEYTIENEEESKQPIKILRFLNDAVSKAG